MKHRTIDELKQEALVRVLSYAMSQELKGLTDLIRLSYQVVLEVEKTLKNISGEEKKGIVIEFLTQIVEKFFDEDIKSTLLVFIEQNAGQIIDSAVWLGNNSKVFTKHARCC